MARAPSVADAESAADAEAQSRAPEGACLILDEDGTARVRANGHSPLPLTIQGPYLTSGTSVVVVGATSGQRIQLPPEDADRATVFNVSWPPEIGDDLIQVSIRDDQHEAAGSRVPSITLRAPSSAAGRSTRVSWRSSDEHGLFDVKVLSARGKQVVDHAVVLTDAWQVSWSRLVEGDDYRVFVRERAGRTVKPVCELPLSWHEGEFPEAIGELPPELGELRAVLTSGDRTAAIPQSVANVGRDADSVQLANDLGLLLYDVFDGPKGIHAQKYPVNFPGLEKVARRAASRDECSHHVRDVLEYLALYGVAERYFRTSGFRDPKFLAKAISTYDFFTAENGHQLLADLEKSPAYREGSFAAAMTEGLVLSTFDRTAAAAKFEEAGTANPELSARLRIDAGASTYLSEEQVEGRLPALTREHETLSRTFMLISPMPTWNPGEHMYVCSCDQNSFRAYFPLWLAHADQLNARGASVHFLLGGDVDEVKPLLEGARELRRAVGRLRGGGARRHGENISFSVAAIPPNLRESQAFSDCSRFLFARQIAGAYRGPLVISDIDPFFGGHAHRHLAPQELDLIGVQARQGFMTLKPWRRFGTARFVLPNSEPLHEHFSVVERYITAGLAQGRTLALNQNALACLIERMIAAGDRSRVVDLGGGAPT